jgi:hypothetical protein
MWVVPVTFILLSANFALYSYSLPDNIEEVDNVLDHGAKGDGTFDNAAILTGLLDDSQKASIYLPNGTYLVSGMVYETAGRRCAIIGESIDKTIIKLTDSNHDYDNINDLRPVIRMGGDGDQAFQFYIRNLTIDVGKNNPAACGIRYQCVNIGSIENVRIVSSDPAGTGHTGLDLTWAPGGPWVMRNITIEGFDYGIRLKGGHALGVFENITVKNQHVAGIHFPSSAYPVCFRNLTSDNTVAVITADGGTVNILNGVFSGGSKDIYAIEKAKGCVYLRNITAPGYKGCMNHAGAIVPSAVTEYFSETQMSLFDSPPTMLNLPVEETPEVPYEDPSKWANASDYNTNDATIDEKELQAAIDAGKKTVCIGAYTRLNSTIYLRKGIQRLIGFGFKFHINSKWFNYDRDDPALVIEGDVADTLIIEGIIMKYGGGAPTSIVNKSTGVVILKDVLGASYVNTVPGGKLFLQDVDMTYMTMDRQEVWMRSLNPERSYGPPYIINKGSKLWVLGFKTEDRGTIFTTTDGGLTEVIGGLVRVGSQEIPADMAAFKVVESGMSVAGVGMYHMGGQYNIVLEETRDGITKKLLRADSPGFAQFLTAYKDGSQNGVSPLQYINGSGLMASPFNVSYQNNSIIVNHPAMQKVFIYTAAGELVYSASAQNSFHRVETNNLSAGTYFLSTHGANAANCTVPVTVKK